MKSDKLGPQEFVDLLLMKSGLNLTDLAEALGVTRATLHNWRNGTTNKISHGIKKKLGQAVDKNRWGFRLTGFSGNHVEVSFNSDSDYIEKNIIKDADYHELKEIIIDQAKEIKTLKEKLYKYESK